MHLQDTKQDSQDGNKEFENPSTHSSVHLTVPNSNNKSLISGKGDDMMNTVR